MNKQILLLLLSAIISIASCTPKPDPEKEVLLLRQTTDSLLKALNQKNVDLFVTYYDSAALFISPTSGVHNGIEEIKANYGGGFALPGFYISGSIQDVQVAKSGDIGYTVVPWGGYYTPDSGKRIEQKGVNVLVWKKQNNGTWRVVVDKP
ncbi:MAG TPA: DUF4440 domain-containing protein [Bacteroidales bacterium]|nr:DUF4440 domain-containing protein [Bacteroidales bacterium]